MIVLERSYGFAASHLYRRPEWDEERNRAAFGRCAQLPGHGHNYRLTVKVAGGIDRETGFSIDLPRLDAIVREKLLDRLDHRHVNDSVAERFGPGLEIPTTENLANWLAEELRRFLPASNRLIELRLAEDDRLASVWTPDPNGPVSAT